MALTLKLTKQLNVAICKHIVGSYYLKHCIIYIIDLIGCCYMLCVKLKTSQESNHKSIKAYMTHI